MFYMGKCAQFRDTQAASLLAKIWISICRLINSGGVTQTPWSEGQNVHHLEPMGFIKFDILGLSTLKMIGGAIYHILKRHHGD